VATKQEFLERLQQISDLFADIATHATHQASFRCPYKNRLQRCTAQFACRNQRKPTTPGDLMLCGGDDKIDYRPAWEK
jgi:hypothetical protein